MRGAKYCLSGEFSGSPDSILRCALTDIAFITHTYTQGAHTGYSLRLQVPGNTVKQGV